MAVERSPIKPKRIKEQTIVKTLAEEWHDDSVAKLRIDKLLFDFIIKYPGRLQKWLDQGRPED